MIEDRELIFSQVDFGQIKNLRILITGGSGFVGHWMGIVPGNVNVTSLNHLQYDFGKWHLVHWDAIIHLANVPPRRVIECARRSRCPVLYASSGSVVTDIKPGDYTLGKMQAEQDLLASGVDVKIARMFTFAGGWMKNHFALTNMIYDALSGDNIKIRSASPRVTRSYLYAADMAVWLWNILIKGEPGSIYEVGSTYAVNMQTLASEIQRNFEPRPLIEHEPMYFNEPRPYYVPDTAKTIEQIGVVQYTPFEETISKTVAHYRREMESING